MKNISTVEEFNELVANGAIPVDVRTQAEYDEAKIPGAQTGYDWNSGEFYDKEDELDPNNSYIFICRSGNRSMQACMYLGSNGFENVYNLDGGMMNWQGETE